MSALYDQVLMHYIDTSGQEAASMLTTQDQSSTGTAPYVALANALQAVSDCGVIAVERRTVLLLGGAPVDGPYKTVFDRGVLFGKILGTNQQTRLPIVGPKAAIFSPGHVNIDLTNPLIITLMGAAVAVLGSHDGTPVASYTRGRRQEAKPSA